MCIRLSVHINVPFVGSDFNVPFVGSDGYVCGSRLTVDYIVVSRSTLRFAPGEAVE